MSESLKPRPNKPQIKSDIKDTANNSEKNKNYQQKDRDMVNEIGKLSSLRNYYIRDLVNDSKKLGKYLKNQSVETNQIRKFLDAINRLKFNLAQNNNEIDTQGIESDLIMLKLKLAYAVARASKKQEKGIEQLSKVMSEAIDKITELKEEKDLENFKADFERLVQLIESIIAYHK